MIYFIGIDGKQAVNSQETLKQIEEVKKLKCSLQIEMEAPNCNLMYKGAALTWNHFDRPKESDILFQSILEDRKMRVDEKIAMTDRPAFCVITEHEDAAVRLEYYEGQDSLSLVYDFRTKKLKSKKLPEWMASDSHVYHEHDLAKFFNAVFGSPEDTNRPIIEANH